MVGGGRETGTDPLDVLESKGRRDVSSVGPVSDGDGRATNRHGPLRPGASPTPLQVGGLEARTGGPDHGDSRRRLPVRPCPSHLDPCDQSGQGQRRRNNSTVIVHRPPTAQRYLWSVNHAEAPLPALITHSRNGRDEKGGGRTATRVSVVRTVPLPLPDPPPSPGSVRPPEGPGRGSRYRNRGGHRGVKGEEIRGRKGGVR